MFAFRILLFACILSAVPFSRTSRSDSDTPPHHAAATLEDLQAWVGESIARMEFEAAPAGDEFQAPNRALRLRTWFRYDGVEVFPHLLRGGAEWVWKWRTLALGDPGRPGKAGTRG